MSAGSFLKKLGGYLITAAQVAGKIDPELQLFTRFLPASIGSKVLTIEQKAVSELTLFSQSIVAAEVAVKSLADKGLTGQDAARIAAVDFTQIIQNTELMLGKEVQDPASAQQIAARLAGDWADWWNNVKPKHIPDAQ